jgi:hypothetical protein
MIKRYIKKDSNESIIDLFCEHQKSKFDGTEIEFDEVDKINHKINDKSISNEYGAPVFKWTGSKAVARTKAKIDQDQKTINGIKKDENRIVERKIKRKYRELAISDLLSSGEITQDQVDNLED